ncbi:MAG: geranylgeranylglycerol-phosphate geranylgeranyltransferase [Flavobacterium sp.]|uniref:geranylgeranylglycerol-phosphate geranylgeranyltransferase n=1 Tax=Flavobacterium sp. TaxID=239 RepID=UPI0026391787|nr:geranylgeranylglycerol-phosphate geranylgeranyltransferase [Flavobacterium sp.]MDD5150818.1 geranylgeranylglycerol-phosphate geranylgeranyltransferase [Flavobacterium sp.]
MLKILKLIRYQNLLMLAFMQLIFRYGFLKLQNIPLALLDWQYGLLVLSTVCIAAGGYIINNILDVETDLENKPEKVIIGKTISETKAYNFYIFFTIIGVTIGFYLSNVINKPGFASLFIIIAATLYFYATSLKQSLLFGNIIVAFLLSLSVLIIGIFDLYPVTFEENKPIMGLLFGILLDYAIFAFIINFIREIVKDLEDFEGDLNQGMNTLPIAFGVNRTVKLVFGLSFIPIICIIYYINQYVFASGLFISTIYGLAFILAPLIYFTIKIWNSKTKKEFHILSMLLKWILFFGMLSIVVISLNMKHNA